MIPAQTPLFEKGRNLDLPNLQETYSNDWPFGMPEVVRNVYISNLDGNVDRHMYNTNQAWGCAIVWLAEHGYPQLAKHYRDTAQRMGILK